MMHSNTIVKLLATILCLFSLAGQAQIKPVYNVPSPDVASLGTYGSVPVSMFTGTPDISVPLCQLSAGNYTFPITATYHPAAVKPNAQPGIIGLGWSLHSDGYITRTVHGVYDEKKCNRFEHGYYGHARQMRDMTYTQFDQIISDSIQTEGSNHNWFELSPDEFSFSFCGYSGRFYLNENGGWTVVSDDDIKLEFHADGDGFVSWTGLTSRIPRFSSWPNHTENQRYFNKFTLITPDGCRYEFGGVNATEYSIPYYSRDKSDLIPTTWRLSRIVTPQGYQILFSYDTSSVMCDIQYTPMTSQLIGWNAHKEYLVSNNTGFKGFAGYMIYPVNISKIVTPNEIVNFNYQFDWSYGNHFDNGIPLYWESNISRNDPYINISNPQNQFFMLIDASRGSNERQCRDNISNALVSKYLLRMAVTERYGGKGRSFFFDYQPYPRRLLDSISYREGTPELASHDLVGGGVLYKILSTPPNTSSQDMPVWRFSYNRTAMPLTYTRSTTDTYGYYYGGEHKLTDGPEEFTNKQPNLQGTLAMTLKSVQWPTGGYTDFSYELNDYSKTLCHNHTSLAESSGTAGGLRIAQIANRDRYDSILSIKRYYYRDSYNSTKSSGIRGETPIHEMSYKATTKNNVTATLMINSAGGFFPCVTGQTAPFVGYSSVIEETLDGTGRSLGYVQSSFSNYSTERMNSAADYCYQMEPFTGITPYTSVSPEIGKLQKKEYYDANNKLVKKEEYTYSRICDGSIKVPYCQVLFFCKDPYHFLSANVGCITRAYTFSYLPAYIKETTKSIASEVFTTSEKKISYDSIRQIKQEQTLQSNGEWASTDYTYPYNDSKYSWMTNRHYMSYMITKNEKRQGSERSFVLDYDANDRSTTTPYIKKLTIIRKGSPTTEYQVVSADSYGNPKEIIENGKHTTLVWSYFGQRLRLRLENYSLALQGEPTVGITAQPWPKDGSNTDVFREGQPSKSNILDSLTTDLLSDYQRYPNTLIHLYEYDGCLKLKSYTNPTLQTRRYYYGGLDRLIRVSTNDKYNKSTSDATLYKYKYDYYNDNENEAPDNFVLPGITEVMPR